jgi:hypothetical protein
MRKHVHEVVNNDIQIVGQQFVEVVDQLAPPVPYKVPVDLELLNYQY